MNSPSKLRRFARRRRSYDPVHEHRGPRPRRGLVHARGGRAAMTRTLGEFLLGALVTGIIAGLGAYFGSYLRESGRQRAIEESVARLTNTTEEIKAAVSG